MTDRNSSIIGMATQYLHRDTKNRTECAFPGVWGTPAHRKTYCAACKHKTRTKIATDPKERNKYN